MLVVLGSRMGFECIKQGVLGLQMKTMSRTLVFAVVPQMVSSCLQESDAQCAPQPTSSELGSCWVVQADVEFVILMLLACCKLSVLGYLTRSFWC